MIQLNNPSSSGGGTPGSPNTSIQYNNSGTFGGDASLIFDSTNKRIGLGEASPSYSLDIFGTAATTGVRSAIGYDIRSVEEPTTITGVVSAGGSVDTGTHYYLVTFYTAIGETSVKVSSVITTTAGNNVVTLTLPTSTDSRVIGRKLYRSKAGQSFASDYILATIADNTTTTYVDSAADSTLTGTAPVAFYRTNTTAKYITNNGIQVFTPDRNATYVGLYAGYSNVNGGYNAFIGYRAGYANLSGSFNTFVGQQTSQTNTTGGLNTAVGYLAMGNNTQGGSNTVVGVDALYSNQTGSFNTIMGTFSLFGSTNASGNTAVGYNSARYLADGSTSLDPGNSVYIGNDTRGLTAGETNAIVIGYQGRGLGTNTTVIGNDSTTVTSIKGDILLTKGGSGVIGPYLYIEGTSSGAVDSEFGFFCAGRGSGNNFDGPYFGARGNLFTRFGDQRGYMFFVAGNPTGTMYGNDGMLAFQATTDTAFVNDGNTLMFLGSGNISGSPYGMATASIGYNSIAGGNNSVAIGYISSASNTQATAIGNQCAANGAESIAIGGNATADNYKSLAIGNNCAAYSAHDMVLGTGIFVGTTYAASTMLTAGDAGLYSPYLTQDNTFFIFGADTADPPVLFRGGVGLGEPNNIIVTGNIQPTSVWTVCGSFASMTVRSSVDYYLYHYDCKLILEEDGNTAYLPDATRCHGREYTIKSVAKNGTVYITTQYGQLLDDASPPNPYPVAQYESYTVFSDGRNWYFRSMYRP